MINRAWQKLKVTAIVLSAVVLLQPSQGFSANVSCADAVKNLDLSETSPLDPQTIDQKIQNLAALKLSLDLAKVNGSSSVEFKSLKFHYESKEWELVDYLEKSKIMTREQLVKKIKQQIAVLQGQNDVAQENRDKENEEEARRKNEQDRVIKEFGTAGYKAIFHKVTPGDFMRIGEVERAFVHLTTMPEIMTTPMTQFIYKTVAELFNARFPEQKQIIAAPSKFPGDTRPVEQVRWHEVQRWTKALNDLSDIDVPELYELIPSHKKGMHYSGFMSAAQREYLMKMAKTEDGDSIDWMIERGDLSKLKEYADFGKKESEGTPLVDSKKPLFIEGKAFYGLNGLIWEWTKDTWNGADPQKGGTDPIDPVSNRSIDTVAVLGGSSLSGIDYLRSTARGSFNWHSQESYIGFRLVRIVE